MFDRDKERTEDRLYQGIKLAGKKLGMALLKAIGVKGLIVLFFIFLILSIAMIFIGAFYSAFPQERAYTEIKRTEKQTELEIKYQEIAEKNNLRDAWLVYSMNRDIEKMNSFTIIKEMKKLSPNNPLYSKETFTKQDIEKIMNDALNAKVISGYTYNFESGSYEYTKGKYDMISSFHTPRKLVDYYGNDSKHLNSYGIIHMASFAKMLNDHHTDTDNYYLEKYGEQLRPLLYYKKSSITVCCPCEGEGCNPCSTTSVYLLTEAYTIQGHYIYDYEWVTEQAGECTITYEKLIGETIIGLKYERLDKWIEEVLLNEEEDFDLTRTMLIEVAEGTMAQKEWLEWLFRKPDMQKTITQGIIDPLLLSYFQEAEKIFGIPAWFLMAIAFKESSFITNAENNKTGAYGLMQLIPETQERMVDKLVSQYSYLLSPTFLEEYNNNEKSEHFYRNAVSDPKINILAGVLCLLEKGLQPEKINWEGNWQGQVLPFLSAYGGFNEVPQKFWGKYDIENREEARLKENVFKWAKDEYADEIFKIAERMKIEKVLPFFTEQNIFSLITSHFGERIDPHSGQHTFHHGTDFGIPTGTPLLAVVTGEVKEARYHSIYGYTVVISNGIYSFRYAHMSQIDVVEGQMVQGGSIIGKSGNTGKSTGPHLHFEVIDLTKNTYINPLLWLKDI